MHFPSIQKKNQYRINQPIIIGMKHNLDVSLGSHQKRPCLKQIIIDTLLNFY